jgi:hypothetical protein
MAYQQGHGFCLCRYIPRRSRAHSRGKRMTASQFFIAALVAVMLAAAYIHDRKR